MGFSIKKILRESLLFEDLLQEGFDVEKDTQFMNVPFEQTRDDDDYKTYVFKLNELDYYVDVVLMDEKKGLPAGTYDVLFGFEGQKGSGDAANVGPNHLKQVLYTTARIMDKECKENKIEFFHCEGFPSDKELGVIDGMSSTKRSRIYYKFFSEYYSADALIATGRMIVFNMKKVYPDVFKEVEDGETYKEVMELLGVVNDNNPNYDLWGDLTGVSNDYAMVTGEIKNSSYGGLVVNIVVNEPEGQYDIGYNKFERGEKDMRSFNDFKSLYEYMEERLLKNETVNQG